MQQACSGRAAGVQWMCGVARGSMDRHDITELDAQINPEDAARRLRGEDTIEEYDATSNTDSSGSDFEPDGAGDDPPEAIVVRDKLRTTEELGRAKLGNYITRHFAFRVSRNRTLYGFLSTKYKIVRGARHSLRECLAPQLAPAVASIGANTQHRLAPPGQLGAVCGGFRSVSATDGTHPRRGVIGRVLVSVPTTQKNATQAH